MPDATQAEAFEFLAKFENIERWDPGVKSSKLAPGSAASGIGAVYDLVTLFKGSESAMKYEVTEYSPPRHVRLKGEGDSVLADDLIEVDAHPSGGAKVSYTADIKLKWPSKLFTWFVASDIRKLGDDAIAGMERAFAEGKHKK